MSAEALVDEARACGIELKFQEGALVLEADRPPPSELLERLRARKADIARLVQTAYGWDQRDWQAYFDERAAIAEFDGDLPRAEAEREAFGACVREWQHRHPQVSAEGHCIWCGQSDAADSSVVLPFEAACGEVWLHADCWEPWSHARQTQAVAALAEMGISVSVEPKMLNLPKDFGKTGSE